MASGAPQQQKKEAITSASKPALKKAVFVKVETLKPGTSGHNITAKVISAAGQGRISECLIGDDTATVLFTARNHQGTKLQFKWPLLASSRGRIAECLIGDDTSIVLFTARNQQVDLMKPGSTVIIRNAKIDMFKGSMRLAVDKWGRVEVMTDPVNFVVKEDNNLSLIEYELVNVVEK